jgi:isoaspartyl peptidase/L-asparaginase-like protein (Ntn-hydrolase superfamily)
MRFLATGMAALALVAACKTEQSSEQPAPTPTPTPPAEPAPAAAIAHGGVGSAPELADGCRAAVDAALAAIDRGEDPLAAAIAGVVILEDDPRFNAGTGSRVRLDGKTVQMDAAVMRSWDGRFGAVAIIENVKNPVLVARAVLDTPHIVLAGDGATRFARSLGMPEYDPATEERKQQTAELISKLRRADPMLPPEWNIFDWRARWNFETTMEAAGLTHADVGSDTVGVAVRAADGRFAVALSTGGTTITLLGRIGDVPILGAGLYTGPRGAVAATGTGERIIEATLSRRVYDWMAAGESPAVAAQRGVDELTNKGGIGLIVIGERDMTAKADRPMAWAARALGSGDWLGPEPRHK